jgi:hypothetical protein
MYPLREVWTVNYNGSVSVQMTLHGWPCNRNGRITGIECDRLAGIAMATAYHMGFRNFNLRKAQAFILRERFSVTVLNPACLVTLL